MGWIYLPVAISYPRAYNIMLTINVMNKNGIKTMIQDINPKSISHNIFKKNVIIIVTIILTNAVLYNPFIKSNIIWIVHNNKYNNAGVHIIII